MNFQHLKYFLMVAEELNITRAAKRLYISQQSLSNHIGKLEQELETQLFTRSPKLALTYAGSQLVDTATHILELYNQYLVKVGDINQHYIGTLRVGISHTCGLSLLPDILPQFREEFPQVEFYLFEGNSTQLEEELAHRRVDLIICFEPVGLENTVITELFDQRLMLVVPRAFTNKLFGAQAQQMRVRLAQGAEPEIFREFPFTLIKRGNRTRSIVDQHFIDSEFKPKLVLETENTVTTLALAQAGMGITICPELFLRAQPTASPSAGEVDLFPLADPSTTSKLVAAYRQDLYVPHYAHRFIEITKQILLHTKA